MSNLVELWGLRWVEYPKELICLDLAGTNARLIHLDDWQFTFKDQAPTVGKTPEEALEQAFGPPIQVLGVTYYPMPPEDSCKQYLPEPRGQGVVLVFFTQEQLWMVQSYWVTDPNPEQALLAYLNYREVSLREDLKRTLQKFQDWRRTAMAFKTQP